MQQSNYAPRPLSTSREYPGYQFAASLRLSGHSAAACLCRAALTVQDWLCRRIREAGEEVPEALVCPEAAEGLTPFDLKGCRLRNAEILSLPERGIWTLMVREPDQKVPARSFVTRVGLRVRSGEEVAFGVVIDVLEQDPTLPEVEEVYRPQFVRLLFEMEGMTLRQEETLLFRSYGQLDTKKAVQRLKVLSEAPETRLPLVVFTPVQAEDALLEALLDGAARSAASRELAMPENVDLQRKDVRPGVRVSPPGGGKRSAGGGGRPAEIAALRQQLTRWEIPYDVAEFARHLYGFAQAYTASGEVIGELKARFGARGLMPGDILVVEPRSFGGAVKMIHTRAGLKAAWYASVLEELMTDLRRWTKHKPYPFGSVMFDEEARQLLLERELERMRDTLHVEKNEEAKALLFQLEQEREQSAAQARHIEALKAQLAQEYQRGAEDRRAHAEELERLLNEARADRAELKQKNASMQSAFGELTALRAAAEGVQTIREMPRTAEDVASFFRLVFADRIDFTQRGLKSVARCGINPELLWSCLYQVSTLLVELHRKGAQDVEKRFREATGWEVAMTEGAMTRKDPKYMELRRDTYQGREISIEPHVKFTKSLQKTGAKYQRLYYAYDPQTRRIVVGYVGDHLENFLSLGVH